jgi:hypothetical protein
VPFAAELEGRLAQQAMKLVHFPGCEVACLSAIIRASYVSGALCELCAGLCRVSSSCSRASVDLLKIVSWAGMDVRPDQLAVFAAHYL